MRQRLRALRGVARSLAIYYRPGRRAALDRMHAPFVGARALAFDIGAHVGDRIASLRRLGARVIACEPQPTLAQTLRLLYGRDPAVTVEAVAVGATRGQVPLHLNLANPTVSTASSAFIAAAAGAPGWVGQHWEQSILVPQTTLDDLIARHGRPDFCKIDVEGFEAQVLRGLSQPVPALSFEFTLIQRSVALAALAELQRLGTWRYNAALGESQHLIHRDWLDVERLRAWLMALPMQANSGDIYACSMP